MSESCSFPGCGRPEARRGHCIQHRRQVVRGEELRPIPRRATVNKGRTCSFPACGRPAYALGLCKGHHSQQRRGDALYPIGDRAVLHAKRRAAWDRLSPEEQQRRTAGLAVPWERTPEFCKRMSDSRRTQWREGDVRFPIRRCFGCGVEFTPNSNRQTWCTPECRRDHRKAREYGLTLEELRAIEERQGGGCAICAVVGARLYVDHCHATSAVRGLLCNRCNTGLGKFGEDADMLRRAIAYIDATP